MKTISTELQAHLAGECLTLAHCWKITRTDGEVMGFTEHDQDLIYETVTYQATTGFTPTAIASQSSLAVDNLDIQGMLSAGAITDKDILAGRYDFAEVETFLINYNDIGQGALSLRKGWLGEVQLNNNQFIAEVRGLTQALSTHIGELYAPICRATFGDSRCAVDTASYTVTGMVTSASSSQQFADSTRSEANGSFDRGVVTFTSGENEGISREVKEFRASQLTLALPTPYPIQLGDGYSLVKGCDKSFRTCVETYNNAVNFRGEPHVPGLDRMLETAGTRNTT